MSYTPQGLRDLVATSQNARNGDMPAELERLKQALMRSPSAAVDILRRVPGMIPEQRRASSANDGEVNDMAPASGGTPVQKALPANLPPEGMGMNSPRGGPVGISSPQMTPMPEQRQAPDVNSVENDEPTSAQEKAAASVKDIPSTGKAALAGQYSDIEKMLGKYTNNDQEDSSKHFTDFLKLTLARAAMSKDNNYLTALGQGAGQATFDQQAMADKNEKDRMEAINSLISTRKATADEAEKQQQLAMQAPYYAAHARYLDAAAGAKDQPKITKVPIGFDGALNKSIKDTYADKYADLDPTLKQQLKSTAADVWKQAGGQLSPSQAMDEAVAKLGADPEALADTAGHLTRSVKWSLPASKGLPPKDAIAAEMARRRLIGGGQ